MKNACNVCAKGPVRGKPAYRRPSYDTQIKHDQIYVAQNTSVYTQIVNHYFITLKHDNG